jgi:hypothetical protein
MAAAKRVSKGTYDERIVLSVALVDADDDHDGASFMVTEQRRAARKLATGGFLKIVSDTRAEVIAKLTTKGRRLIEQRERGEVTKPLQGNERKNLSESVRKARIAYQDASNEFQSAKREGPSERIDRAYCALGSASVDRENAELVLEQYEKKHR